MYYSYLNQDQISRGEPIFPKILVLGEQFSTENFGPGDQNSGDSSDHFVKQR